MGKARKLLPGFLLICLLGNSAVSQEQGYEITQGEFAIQLVNVLNLQSYLPPAPLVNDYVSILELFGISPLIGWKTREPLTEEDYIVVMAKLSGQEREVYKTGVEFCNKIVRTINEAWADQQAKDGQWESLDQLFQDPRYFGGEVPQCPFGFHYKTRHKKNEVKRHIHIQRFLTSLRFGI